MAPPQREFHMPRLLLGIIALTLAGCQSAREQALHAAIQDGATCRTMGAQPGTQTYDRCRKAQERNRMDEDAPVE